LHGRSKHLEFECFDTFRGGRCEDGRDSFGESRVQDAAAGLVGLEIHVHIVPDALRAALSPTLHSMGDQVGCSRAAGAGSLSFGIGEFQPLLNDEALETAMA
jgi:hypothetical protein